MKVNEVLQSVDNGEFKKEVESWLKIHLMRPGRVSFNPITNEVNYDGDVVLARWGEYKIPFKFGIVNGECFCEGNYFRDLTWSPTEVKWTLNVGQNGYLTSLEGLNCKVGGTFVASGTAITNLHNIHKQLLSVGGGTINLNGCEKLKSHILSVALVKGVKQVIMSIPFIRNMNLSLGQVITKTLSSGGDILALQDVLISLGLEEFARL